MDLDYYSGYCKVIDQGLSSIIATTIAADSTNPAGDANASATFAKTKSTVDVNEALAHWVQKAFETRLEKGTFFFVGNGASATMAEHLSHDCFQNADMLTETISETSHLTAIANDISYHEIFSYRINKMATDKDMLITISSSGNSPNIIRALEVAQQKDMFTVTLSGMKPDNHSRAMGALNFYVPLQTYGTVESAHAVLLHCWLDLFMDTHMGGRH